MNVFPPILLRFGITMDAVCRNGRGPLNLPCKGDWHWTCYLPLLIPFVFIPITWILIFSYTARMSGWRELARRFASPREPEGARFRWQSLGVFSMGGYNNCLKMTVSERGLYLAVHSPFGLFHDPLLIPWSEFEWVSDKTSFGFRYSEFRMKALGSRLWRVPGKVVKAARKQGHLPDPGAPAP